MAYRYKTKPLPHQREYLQKHANKEAWGLFWSPGVGKTKPLIDNLSYLYQAGRIDAVLVVAPNGVHRNWVSDEIPAHMPDEVQRDMRHLVWKSVSFKSARFQREMKEILRHQGLSVVVVAYESTITEGFKKFAKKLFAQRRVFMVLDESHRIKNPKSKVKTTLTAFGKYAHYRRIATGTPLEQPFDLYSQVRFLDPNFWKVRGFPTLEDFKHHFGVFVDQRFGGRSFEKCVSYKNLPELSQWVKEITHRLTKEDAGLNLPPKMYTKRYHSLTPEQLRVYNELRDQYSVELQSGDLLEAESAMTRMLRLQQICCNFVSCEAEQPTQRIDPKKNTRMDLCVDEILDSLPHQAIVFSRFIADIDELCRRLGDKCVRYDGQVKDNERARAKLAFQRGDKQFFIASNAGAEGQTLVGSKTMVFYSNDFQIIKRLQKEDRQHRIGQTDSVLYIDIVAENTVDEYIVETLVRKHDIVTQVLQDTVREWLR